MKFLLDIVYGLGLLIISPLWLYRMIFQGRYRRGIAGRFGKSPVTDGSKPVIWLHAVSLGEINGIRRLVESLASSLGDSCVIAVSTTTDTGMTQALKLYGEKYTVFQFPMDFSFAVSRVFRRLKPSVIVLMEGEIWPNLLMTANRLKVPVALVNGRMSRDRGYPRYKKVRPLACWMFNKIDVLAVQEKGYAESFISLGTDKSRVRVTGMMKYDTAEVYGRVAGCDELAEAMGICPSDRLIVAGGTGPGEEKLLVDMFSQMRQSGRISADVKLAIIPRKPERFDEVARIINSAGFIAVRRSEFSGGGAVASLDEKSIILGDTMGELRKFYSLAECVFVGRSLVEMGGSDMIEAAALGKPVAFGPHVYNFPQAADMLAEKVAVEVADTARLADTLCSWLTRTEAAKDLGRRARDFVVSRQGATEANAKIVVELLDRESAEIKNAR